MPKSINHALDHKQEEIPIMMTSKEREKEKDSAGQIKTASEAQIEKHRGAHQKQLSELRDEIVSKIASNEAAVEQLQDALALCLAQEKNQIDLDKLREEVDQKTAKLNELTIMSDKREQAHEDLKGLQETVTRALQNINRIREMFLQNILTGVEKFAAGEDIDIGSQIQQEKISFLETNLEMLTNKYQALVTAHSELEREKPKLEKKVQMLEDHVHALEQKLRESVADYHRLRVMFVQSMVTSVEKSTAEEDIDIGGSQIEQEKISFLENNLDRLTTVHRDLVTADSGLEREKPKLEKKVQMLEDHVHALEKNLRESEEGRHRYKKEVNRFRERMRRSLMSARSMERLQTTEED